MAARGSTNLLLDTVEELLAELPSRLRGSRERFSESALSVLPLRPLVAVQAGVALLGLAGTSLEWSDAARQC